jgi:hypothetical protein
LKKLFFCLLLLYGFKNCYSQNDSLLQLYNNQTIYRFGDKYLKGNETLRFYDLKHEFKSSITAQLYTLSKRNLVTSKILSFASLAAILVSGTFINKNRDLSFGLLCGSIVLNIGNFHLRKLSQQYLDRALWQRNKEILFGER